MKAAVVACVLLWASAVHAQPATPEVAPARPDGDDAERALMERVVQSYDQDRYDEALQLLSEGYRRFGKPLFLFNIAQAQRLGRHCPEALSAYERFLAVADPGDEHRALAQQQAAEMRRCVSLMSAPQASPPPVHIQARAPAAEPTPPAGWSKRQIMRTSGIALMATGIAAAVGATIFAIEANKISSRDTFTPDDFTSGQRANRWAIGLAVAAGVMAAGGTLTFILAPATPLQGPSQSASGTEMLVCWSGRF